MSYSYDFSVVMAVYNVEPFLRETIDSLVVQDFGFEKIQLILVDDGSTDGSSEICDEYKEKHSNIFVIHKENGGVASARNLGLKYASGRFINFMDSDDKFTPNAFSEAYSFFVEHEKETDIVTVPLRFFDAQQGEHWQNDKFRKGNRIIDLYTEYASPLMFVNASFFHNRIKNSIEFDSHLVCGEDIKVILTVISSKMKLGVLNTCRYLYRRQSTGEASLIQSSKKKYGWYFDYFTYLVDWAVEYYTTLFGYLPAFVQYELLCDLQWRFREKYEMNGILTSEEIDQYKKRLSDTLKYFDDKYILEQKMPYTEHKCMMLCYKYKSLPYLSQTDNDFVIHFGNTIIGRESCLYTMIEFITISYGKIEIDGYTKVLGIPIEEPLSVYIKCNEKMYQCNIYNRKEINEYRFEDELLFRGIAFKASIPLPKETAKAEINFYVKYKDVYIHKKEIRYGKFTPLSRNYNCAYYCSNGYMLQGRQTHIEVSAYSKRKEGAGEWKYVKELWKRNQTGNRKAIVARICSRAVKSMIGNREIWLISDRPQKAGDNGEAFFNYVLKNADKKIIPYFVIMKDSADYKKIKKKGRVVNYLSWKHKILQLAANIIVSSQADEVVFNPFFNYAEQYKDLLQKPRFVFLQHGVTENNVDYWFNKYRTNISGFVCSAIPERNSILNGAYYYSEKEVWLTGMPRYDCLYHDEQKQITIIPTWRAYLVENDRRTGIRSLKDGFEKSNYFKIYSRLLSDKRVIEAAHEFGYKILFVCHPNMKGTKEYFEKNENIIVEESASYSKLFAETDLLITDYSSVGFDFAYLRKPMIYYQNDIEEFFSGNHTTQKGYFDYEKNGFGEVEYSLEKLVDRIVEYLENGCKLKQKYRDRIDSFFAFNDKNNCQRVYERIIQMEGEKH